MGSAHSKGTRPYYGRQESRPETVQGKIQGIRRQQYSGRLSYSKVKSRLVVFCGLLGCCGGSANNWWERSPNSGNSNNFCNVNSNGNANNNNASNSNGVAFGFCRSIGQSK
ncbi:DUF6273 domain-containing protein [uncultured Eubacterium sp.]|uniref:DUF6273 domain-containing protein n=1 Tax=uncultured Eubacterium sp. TaxID=165185 RepID=UPI00345695C4